MQPSITYIQSLVNRIEHNLSDEINIIGLAESFNVSPWHFQRLFKALVGDSLGGYIRGRRLTEAARLLLTGELGIIDIAFSVGFSSHEAFSRAFKTYFGQSPSDFRKNKPTVVLNEKPLLTLGLINHLQNEITHQPVIKTNPTRTLVGFGTTVPSLFVSNAAYCDALAPSWMNLLKRQPEIANQQSKTLYGLTISQSGNFTEDTLSHLAGLSVSQLDEPPSGMVVCNIPQQLVAEFTVASINEETVSRTVDYIYGYWLPNSPYTRGKGNDYELFEQSNGFIDPVQGSKYVIPILPRKNAPTE